MISIERGYIVQLNSKLLEFYFNMITPTLGNKSKTYVERIPVLKSKHIKFFSNLSDYLHLNESFEDIANNLVYELFFHE